MIAPNPTTQETAALAPLIDGPPGLSFWENLYREERLKVFDLSEAMIQAYMLIAGLLVLCGVLGWLAWK